MKRTAEEAFISVLGQDKRTPEGEVKEYEGLKRDTENLIEFKFIYCEDDINTDNLFKGQYAHQILGEEIKGYEDLWVILYFTPITFRMYPLIKYNWKAQNFDQIKEKLVEHWEDSMTD